MSEHEPPRAAADASLVFAVSLVLSLAVSWPSFSAAFSGDLDITVAALRYLVALALSWAGVWLLATAIASFGRNRPPASALPPAPANHPQRRASDPPPLDAGPGPDAAAG